MVSSTILVNPVAKFVTVVGGSVAIDIARRLIGEIIGSRDPDCPTMVGQAEGWVWNTEKADQFERGRILEDVVLGRPGSIKGERSTNFGTIDAASVDDLDEHAGIVQSIKAIDITAIVSRPVPSYCPA